MGAGGTGMWGKDGDMEGVILLGSVLVDLEFG